MVVVGRKPENGVCPPSSWVHKMAFRAAALFADSCDAQCFL